MIDLKGIKKIYANGDIQVAALAGVDLHVGEGEFVAIMGPSGSGKSSMMNILGCLDTPTEGEYFLDGTDVAKTTGNDLAVIRNRKIGFIFQGFNLLPRTTAVENVELPMLYAGVPGKERRTRAIAALESVGLGGRVHHRPKELSGGQQQRVAIARALAFDPDVLLLDEPLSNLDAKLRENVRLELRGIQKKTGKTTIFVTHDQIEALTMSDQIFLMNSGVIEQAGTPFEIYNRPKSTFSADFIGSNNFIDVVIKAHTEQELVIEFANKTLRLPKELVGLVGVDQVGSKARLCVRPENLKWNISSPVSPLVSFEGKVLEKMFMGGFVLIYLDVDGTVLKFQAEQNEAAKIGIDQNVSVSFNECILLP